MSAIAIEPMRPGDLQEVADIYHHYVLTSAHTFDLETLPATWWRDWFAGFDGGRHRLLVAREDRVLLGYALSDVYRSRPAYETSVLTSVYVAPGEVGRGVGTALYRALFASLESEDVHRAHAAISLPNAASVSLHERSGFRLVGRFSEQGRKFGRFWDVAWYERRF